MSIIDRYVIRQVLMPFCIGLLIFTFLLIIPLLIEYAETFIAKGIATAVVLRLMVTLIPQALALTIPMSLLLGLLVAFGRLSADREFVAMQACGVSLLRLLRPVGLLSILCWGATSYVLIEALPWGNKTFVDLRLRILADRAEGEVKPRAFFTAFPDLTLYVREVPPSGGGWDGVFMQDRRPGQTQAIYLARHGHVFINREKQTVEMVMEDGAEHTADPTGEYKVLRFARAVLTLDPAQIFPREGPTKGPNEMTIDELRTTIAELEKNGVSAHRQRIALHHKFAIPLACLVFAILGLAIGATHRRDGSLGSFVVGVCIVFVYYIPLYLGPQMAKGGLIPPWLAAWLPNIIIGAMAVALFIWRDRVADQAIRIPLPRFFRRSPDGQGRRVGAHQRVSRRFRFSILDRYVAMTYLRILALSGMAMVCIFYISTFIDLSDKVFKGMATWGMLLQFFWYSTPQYIYFIIPLSVLLSGLITIGALTKNSELIVMKACGISLYRIATPMLTCAILAAGLLFALEQTILGGANRRAAEIRYVMNGGSPETFDLLSRQWMSGPDGRLYHYTHFDPKRREMSAPEIFEFSDGMRRLTRRTSAALATAPDGATNPTWRLDKGWTREFDEQGQPSPGGYKPFVEERVRLEPAEYFGTEEPEPKFMTFTQLREYVARLQLTGFDVTEQHVALARKLAFPFVTLVMTLIAVPFGVTTGRGGAMAGIGVGIALAITYWTAISIFAALGAGGVLPPTLAAWAPNLLFGAAAAYLLLTVRT
jgi:LPS export ABC transporter permease LptF/LPS export ABC transporter permease LptG